MNLGNIRLSERSLSLSGAQRKCPPRCSWPIRNHFYHKQSYLVRHVICRLLLGYPVDRARKLKRRFSCRSWTGINPFALRYMLNSSLSTNLDSIHLGLSDFHLILLIFGLISTIYLWTWVWVDSGSWWWTGRPGVLRFMGSQRVGHDWSTELNQWPKGIFCCCFSIHLLFLSSSLS